MNLSYYDESGRWNPHVTWFLMNVTVTFIIMNRSCIMMNLWDEMNFLCILMNISCIIMNRSCIIYIMMNLAAIMMNQSGIIRAWLSGTPCHNEIEGLLMFYFKRLSMKELPVSSEMFVLSTRVKRFIRSIFSCNPTCIMASWWIPYVSWWIPYVSWWIPYLSWWISYVSRWIPIPYLSRWIPFHIYHDGSHSISIMMDPICILMIQPTGWWLSSLLRSNSQKRSLTGRQDKQEMLDFDSVFISIHNTERAKNSIKMNHKQNIIIIPIMPAASNNRNTKRQLW